MSLPLFKWMGLPSTTRHNYLSFISLLIDGNFNHLVILILINIHNNSATTYSVISSRSIMYCSWTTFMNNTNNLLVNNVITEL